MRWLLEARLGGGVSWGGRWRLGSQLRGWCVGCQNANCELLLRWSGKEWRYMNSVT